MNQGYITEAGDKGKMKKAKQRKRNCVFGILLIAMIYITAGCAGHKSEDVVSGNDNTGSEIVEEPETTEEPEATKEPEATEELYALESFGDYLEELYTEGRRTELDDRIISTKLDLEEAALLAEKSPLLEHMGMYAEGVMPLTIKGICILSADVNGDGVEDVIEYGPAHEGVRKRETEGANMLNIYLGTGEGSFSLSYAQHFFDTNSAWPNIIKVAKYEGETYLLFFRDSIDKEKQESRVTAYWLSDGMPKGKLALNWNCSGMNVTITENTGSYDTGFLEENRMEIYHAVNDRHCNVDTRDWPWLWWKLCGSGETNPKTEESKAVFHILYDRYSKKYWAEQKPYEEKYAGKARGVAWSVSDMFESDINNDGIMEQYVRRNADLGLMEIGYDHGLYSIFITGEYYGIHEGRLGLVYYMESDGKETDFLKMCGLDIWEGEMTPQYFWVEQTDKGNVTYIAYQDGDEHRQLIEGYLIQGNRYERVVSAEYLPEIECSIAYEAMDESEGVDYIVHCSEDMMSFELEWDNGNGQGEALNHSIRELLEEKMETIDLQGGKFKLVDYNPIEATEEKFVVNCIFYYRVPGEEDSETTEEFCVCINILTGECAEIEGD